jgi:hypothetical protein
MEEFFVVEIENILKEKSFWVSCHIIYNTFNNNFLSPISLIIISFFLMMEAFFIVEIENILNKGFLDIESQYTKHSENNFVFLKIQVFFIVEIENTLTIRLPEYPVT